MEDDLNGRRTQWKTKAMEDDLNGRQPQGKTTSMEDDLNGKQPQGKRFSGNSILCIYGSQPLWKPYRKQMTLAGLASQFRNEICPAKPQPIFYYLFFFQNLF